MSGLGLTFLRRGGQAHPTAGSDYIKFADQAVFDILVAKGVSSDGIGITRDDAMQVTSFSTWFRYSKITSFLELPLFGNLTNLGNQAFHSSTVQTIDLSNIVTFGEEAFVYCSKLTGEINLANAVSIAKSGFLQARQTSLKAPKIETIGIRAFTECWRMTYAEIGENCRSIADYAFQSCPLKTFICHASTPPTMGSEVFRYVSNVTIYVPDAFVDLYKSAAGWSDYAANIKGISEYNG